ncbi:MAG: immunoglobulin domain-containing protein [Chlorobi bacterium]|nr:immunoglobulin domain-containing protein [Chlorobiota bacterium]
MTSRFHLTLLIAFATCTVQFYAYMEGITGRTSVGCSGNGCHANQPNNLTTVLLEGQQTLDPNTIYTFTLKVRNSSAIYAGFNLTALDSKNQPAGMLQYPSTENQYVKSQNGELTHRTRRTMSNQGTYREASWQVQWRAPETPGRYTLRAVGLAADGDGRSSAADLWNFLPTTTVTVRGIILDTPTQSASFCSGDTVTLRWTSYGITTTTILYSSNSGQSWIPAATIEAQDGSNTYRYTIPQNVSAGSNHMFRIASADNELLGTNTPTLTINPRTTIRTQPQSPGNVCEGGTATMSVSATGASLTYQWTHNGSPIPGATSAQLTLSNLVVNQSGNYACVITGACGSVTSASVSVVVRPKPRLLSQSADTTVTENEAAELYITIADDSTATYQWLKNGTAINGATTTRFSIPRTTLSDSGIYTARISNSCGSIMSEPIRLHIRQVTSVETELSPIKQIYPQPAGEHVSVTVSRPIDHAVLYDQSGRIVTVWQEPLDERCTLSLQDPTTGGRLSAGMYVLILSIAGNTHSIPIVIAPY